MTYETKAAAYEAADDILSEAKCSNELIATVVAKMVERGVSLEDLDVLLRGPRVVHKLKAFAGEQAGCALQQHCTHMHAELKNHIPPG